MNREAPRRLRQQAAAAPRRRTAGFLLPVLMLLSSCFTSALWTLEDDDDWTARAIGGRVLLTPFTVLLDCLTWPLQAWFQDDDASDCDPDQPSHRRGG